MQLVKNKQKQIKRRKTTQLQLKKLLSKKQQLLKRKVQIQVRVEGEVQPVKNQVVVKNQAVKNQEDLNQEDLNQEEVNPLEVRKLQEVLKVVQVVGQEEEPQREHQGELIGEGQGGGAILGVSLISQYLQIRI